MHKAVLLQEVISYLQIRSEGFYIDATFGGGSVSREILSRLSNKGRLIAIDTDREAVKRADDLAKLHPNLLVAHSNFSELDKILDSMKINSVDGIVADLGLSSYQLDDVSRGFIVVSDSKMDMRYDMNSNTPKASDILRNYSEKELVALFQKYSEQPFERRIAAEIKRSKPISTPRELHALVERTIPSSQRYKTKKITINLLRGLRMEVNNELDTLKTFIDQAVSRLDPGGRLVVISFQSVEDRVVKNAFREHKHQDNLQIITKKPITPSDEEITVNPRSRSAKLRAAEKPKVIS
jgi:16S rRNA (cytosine1402-N4)-methyltransferase